MQEWQWVRSDKPDMGIIWHWIWQRSVRCILNQVPLRTVLNTMIILEILLYTYLFVSVSASVQTYEYCSTCWCHRTACKNQFFPSTTCVPTIKLKFFGSALSRFKFWDINIFLTIIFYFIPLIYLFISHLDQCPLLISPHRIPPPPLFHHTLKGECWVSWPPPILGYQVSTGLGASFPTVAKQGSPVGKWIPQTSISFRDRPQSSWWGTNMESELHILSIYVRGLGQPLCSSVSNSISKSHQRSSETISLSLPMEIPSESSILPTPLSLESMRSIQVLAVGFGICFT